MPYMYCAMYHGYGVNDGVIDGVDAGVCVVEGVCVFDAPNDVDAVCVDDSVVLPVGEAVCVCDVDGVADDDRVDVPDTVDAAVDEAVPVGAYVEMTTVCTAADVSVADPTSAPFMFSNCTTAPARPAPVRPADGR